MQSLTERDSPSRDSLIPHRGLESCGQAASQTLMGGCKGESLGICFQVAQQELCILLHLVTAPPVENLHREQVKALVEAL